MTSYYALVSYKNTDQALEGNEHLENVIRTIYRTYRFMDCSTSANGCPLYALHYIKLVAPTRIVNASEDYWHYINSILLSWMDEDSVLTVISRYRNFEELACHILEQDPHVYLNKIMAVLPKNRVGAANINSFVGSLT